METHETAKTQYEAKPEMRQNSQKYETRLYETHTENLN